MYKKRIPFFVLLFASHFFSTQIIASDPINIKPKNYVIKKIRDLNMQMFEWEWDYSNAKSFQEYLQWYLNQNIDPTPRLKRLSAFKFVKTYFSRNNFYMPLHEKPQDTTVLVGQTKKVPPTMWKNLELFCSSNLLQKVPPPMIDLLKKANYVAQSIDRTKTEIGKIALFHQLATPTKNIDLLKKRQKVIRTFLENETLSKNIDDALLCMKDSEGSMLQLWRDKNFQNQIVKKMCLFSRQGANGLNKNSKALLIRSFWNHFMRFFKLGTNSFATAALASHGILTAAGINFEQLSERADANRGVLGFPLNYLWKYGKNNQTTPEQTDEIDERNAPPSAKASPSAEEPESINISLYKNPGYKFLHAALYLLGAYLCGSTIKDNAELARDMFLVEKTVHIIAKKMAQYLKSCETVYNQIKEYPALLEFEEFCGLINFFEHNYRDLSELKKLCNDKIFLKEPRFFSNKGKIFKFYKLMCDSAKRLEHMMFATGKVDVYHSCARLFNEFKTKRVKICFPLFEQKKDPKISLKECWHPLINHELVVPNSISLGRTQKAPPFMNEDKKTLKPNMIITGPNAGGKSSFLRTITISLITAQTLGIAPATSMSFTPFTSIEAYFGIVDNINEGQSYFKAEIARTLILLERIQNAQEGEFVFSAFDGIFNNTKPRDGAAAAFGVAKYLGTFKNSICLIATHFPIMTELHENFDNYKVSVIKDEHGNFLPTYKLERGTTSHEGNTSHEGISDQYIALDILQNENCSATILQAAKEAF